MNEKKKLQPKVRFREFTGENAPDWEQRKLGEILSDLYNGQTPSRSVNKYWKGNIPWLTSGELNHGIVENTIEKISESGKRAANLRMIPSGTIVIAITGLEAPGTRGNCAILGIDTTVNQSVMALFVKDNIDIQFIFQWYKKIGQEYGIKYTQGTKQQSYNYDLVKILPINISTATEEQERIGQFFEKLDKLITLHQRKLEQLEQLKNTLLSKMFPKSGTNIPEIRFSGFTDTWKQRHFENIFFEFSNKSTVEDAAPLLSSTNKGMEFREGRVNSESNSGYKIINNNDLVLSPQNLWLGNINFNNLGTGIVSPSYKTFKCKNVDIDFIRPQLRNNQMMYQYKNASTQGASVVRRNLDLDLFNQIIISIPNSEEQKMIGRLFSKIDNSIAIHQRKLEQLKNLKQTLLNKMFI